MQKAARTLNNKVYMEGNAAHGWCGRAGHHKGLLALYESPQDIE